MFRGHRTVAAALLLTLVLPCLGQQEAADEEPRDLGLTERARAELAQLDVTVTGPPEVIADLGPEDFRLKIWLRRIDNFTVDRVCRTFGAETETAVATSPDDAVTIARLTEAGFVVSKFDGQGDERWTRSWELIYASHFYLARSCTIL